MNSHIFTEQAKKISNSYFEFWRRHDDEKLFEIFSDQFAYTMNGEFRFSTLSELRIYWRALKSKQEGVRYNHKISQLFPETGWFRVIYRADFFDKSDWKNLTVQGMAEICLGNEGKIVQFNEHYLTTKSWDVPKFVKQTFAQQLSRIRSASETILRSSRRNLVTSLAFIFGVAYVASVAIAAYMNFLEPNLNLFFKDDKVEAKFNITINALFALGFIYLSIYSAFIAPKRGPIKRYRAKGAMDNLKILHDRLQRSERAILIYGDFSFISAYKPLANQLDELATRRKLTLISSCDEAQVAKQEGTAQHTDLVRSVKDSGRFIFEAPKDIKMAWIERSGEERLIYRFDDGGHEYTAELTGETVDSRILLSRIRKLLESAFQLNS